MRTTFKFDERRGCHRRGAEGAEKYECICSVFLCALCASAVKTIRSSGAKLARGLIRLDAGGEVVLGDVTEHLARESLIGLGPILRESVGIFEILGLELRLKHAVQLGDKLVEGPASTGAGVEHAGGLRRQRFHVGL